MLALHIFVASTAVTVFAISAPAQALPGQNGEDAETIIKRLQQATDRQSAELCGYSVQRRYTLHNKHLAHDAEVTVLLTYDKNNGKTLKVISSDHASGFIRRAMLEVVGAEPKVKGERGENGIIDEANYKFTFLGQEQLRGRSTYHFKIVPRRSSKLLVDGEVWIDATDYAVVRIRGRLSKGISFWLSRPEVEQDFAKYQGFWMPSYNRSVTDVKLAGEADIVIEYSDYHFKPCNALPGGAPH
jgi:hypothetical protein